MSLKRDRGGIGGGAPDVKVGEAAAPLAPASECAEGAGGGEAGGPLAKRANAPKALPPGATD